MEDDLNTADELIRMLRRSNPSYILLHVRTAQEAMDFFERKGEFSSRQTYSSAGLVLIDLGLESKSGFALVEWIRKKSNSPQIPVVVVTTAEQIQFAQQAYRLGATSFLIKPIVAADLEEMILAWNSQWRLRTDPTHSG